MCQPPEISLPSANGADEGAAHASNDGWSAPSEQWVPPAATASLADHEQSMNSLAAQEQAILLKFGQQHQQQQRQRAAHMAALASFGTPAASQTSPTAPWSHGFNHQNLTEKLQRAAASATDQGKGSATPWAPQNPHLTAFGSPAAPLAHPSMWPAPASPALVPHLAPGLVAQGVPLASMTHMDHLTLSQMAAQQSDDEDPLDPKKFKRMMSNRASAKRSRQRRQERLDELEIVSAKLQVENSAVQRRLVEANERIRKFQHENESLQSELRMLKSMVEAKGMGGHTKSTSFCHLAEGGEKQGTNQDSCEPHGSTTEHLSSEQPSCAPGASGPSLGQQKRKLEEGAESRMKSLKTDGEPNASPSLSQLYHQHQQQQQSPATPVSNMTSTSTNGDDSPSADVHAVQAVADEGIERVAPLEEPVLVGPSIGMELLDDDLLSSFMEECFEAKPFEAALVQ